MDKAASYAKVHVNQTTTLQVLNPHTILACRWLILWGISFAPEGKMRNEAKKLVGDNICAEMVQFSFTHKDGGEEIKPAAMAYIPNLWGKIYDLLELHNEDYNKYDSYKGIQIN